MGENDKGCRQAVESVMRWSLPEGGQDDAENEKKKCAGTIVKCNMGGEGEMK